MFRECTSLTHAPQLPATTLTNNCYAGMFNGCTNLTEISVGFTRWNSDTHETYGTDEWLDNVAPNGKFICPKGLPKEFGENRIPEGWKIIKNFEF